VKQAALIFTYVLVIHRAYTNSDKFFACRFTIQLVAHPIVNVHISALNYALRSLNDRHTGQCHFALSDIVIHVICDRSKVQGNSIVPV